VWQNYDFYVRVPIEQSFDKIFLFLGCYEFIQKTNVGKFNSSQEDLGKGPMV
jgi:hypothetical protein